MDSLEAFLYFGVNGDDFEIEESSFKDIKYVNVLGCNVIKDGDIYYCSCNDEICLHKYIASIKYKCW